MIYRRGATTTDANRQGRLQNRSNLKETELFFFFFLSHLSRLSSPSMRYM